MSWQSILNSLPILTLQETEIFAPPRDMETAIASYNRALVNLRSDSSDVAQIALRKLVINYPLFGPASLLFGICLLEQHRFDAALEVIDRARLAGLSSLENRLAEALVSIINEQHPPASAESPSSSKTKPNAKTQAALKAVSESNSQDFNKSTFASLSNGASRPESALSGATPILERTGKPVKTKMASRKEVQKIMRRGDASEGDTTAILEPSSNLKGRIFKITGIAVVLIALTLIAFWSYYKFPTLTFLPQQPNSDARLSFLLNRLNQLSGTDASVATLLADYDTFVTPANQQTTLSDETLATTTSAPDIIETTKAPDPTEIAETTETISQNDLLTQVYSEYQAALILASSDVVTATENLLTVQKAAEGLDEALTSPAVPISVTELQSKIVDSLDMYRTDASDILRLQGREAYDIKDYETSLALYLRAYALKPLAYGGGVAYYCGRNYQALGQNDLARPFYELVMKKFAGSDVADYAEIRLSELS